MAGSSAAFAGRTPEMSFPNAEDRVRSAMPGRGSSALAARMAEANESPSSAFGRLLKKPPRTLPSKDSDALDFGFWFPPASNSVFEATSKFFET